MIVSVEGHLTKLYAIGNIWLLILPAQSVKELCNVEGSQRRGLIHSMLALNSSEV